MMYRIFSLLPSKILFSRQLLDLVGLKPHVLPGRDDRHMDLNLSLHTCSRNEVVQREPLFSKVTSHFLWRTLGPCCFLLAGLPVFKIPRSIQFVHPEAGKQPFSLGFLI